MTTNGGQTESGFIAETAQAAVASYQPHLPADQMLDSYLDGLISRAKAALGVVEPKPESR